MTVESESQILAATVTMLLAACADLDVSEQELVRLKEILVKRTNWCGDDAAAEGLLEQARGRTRDIFQLADDEDRLKAALVELGKEIGDADARNKVLEYALEVAEVDGLDDDERIGMEMLKGAFG